MSNEIVPTKSLVKEGTKGIGSVVGGAVLLILSGLGTLPLLGPILGGIIALGGVGVAVSSKEDRIPGAIIGGAGVLTFLAGVGVGIGSTLLTIGGIGLLAVGGIGLYRFIKGLRSRR